MASVTLTLDEWRAVEAALVDARAMVVDLTPEHPAWDAEPPESLGGDEHRVWAWRLAQVRASLAGVEPPEPIQAPLPTDPPPAPSNAKSVASGILAGLARR